MQPSNIPTDERVHDFPSLLTVVYSKIYIRDMATYVGLLRHSERLM